MEKQTRQKERRSNIELLRIFAIMGVVILHYNNTQIGGGMAYVEDKSLNFVILYFLESVAICAVDLFYMISGFFLANTYERRIRKPIELLTQVALYSLMLYLLRTLLSQNKITGKGIVASMVPTNYFVIFYCVIWFVSPYFNRLMNVISDKESKNFIILMGVIFSFYCTLIQCASNIRGEQIVGLDAIGMYGSQNGYNIVNFLFMYLLGAYIRKFYKPNQVSKLKLVGAFLINSAVITAWSIMNSGYPQALGTTAWIYCNPLVILNAVMLLLLFLKIDIGTSRMINWFSGGVFSVFLLHSYFIMHIGIEKAVQNNPLFMLGHIIVSIVCILVFCTVVDYVYMKISKPIFDAVFKRFNPILVYLEKE